MKVMLVELTVFERITPLASGYLAAYAAHDPAVGGDYDYDLYSTSVKTPPDQIAREVVARDADVYTFSCYVWNMGLVRRLVPLLRQAKPRARILLGGPQVMHHASRYLDPTDEHVALCNGEGEQTFAAYLAALTEPVPDLSTVEGISFAAGGELVTTDQRARITDLDSIPSPYLTGIMPPEYSVSVIETNRGCPYHCGFCYWGAATNDRVYRFDEDRVKDELTWMARNNVVFLYIADANWGMLGRDVELSEHIAECAREYKLPSVVYFSSAKNKPHAVTRITGIFQEAGLVASQPVSMQTMEPTTLDIVARSNIKLSAFEAVQEDLRDRGISSYIELIWPLPGETLASFKNGVNTLCEKNAQTIITYSHLLLNNTPLYHSREQHGLVSRPAGDGAAEAEIVVQTPQASGEDFAEGMRFFYAVHALHNTCSLRTLARYLNNRGVQRYADFFSAFVRYWRAHPTGDVITEFVEHSIENALYYDIGNYGLFIHHILHGERVTFDRQLHGFVREQDWWHEDEGARAAFEIDLVSRPYVYSSTPLDRLDGPFETIRVTPGGDRSYQVEVPDGWHELLLDSVRLEPRVPDGGRFTVDHGRMQFPYMASQGLEHNANYCHGMIEKAGNITPIWRPEVRAPVPG